jgi:hypothetical protein
MGQRVHLDEPTRNVEIDFFSIAAPPPRQPLAPPPLPEAPGSSAASRQASAQPRRPRPDLEDSDKPRPRLEDSSAKPSPSERPRLSQAAAVCLGPRLRPSLPRRPRRSAPPARRVRSVSLLRINRLVSSGSQLTSPRLDRPLALLSALPRRRSASALPSPPPRRILSVSSRTNRLSDSAPRLRRPQRSEPPPALRRSESHNPSREASLDLRQSRDSLSAPQLRNRPPASARPRRSMQTRTSAEDCSDRKLKNRPASSGQLRLLELPRRRLSRPGLAQASEDSERPADLVPTLEPALLVSTLQCSNSLSNLFNRNNLNLHPLFPSFSSSLNFSRYRCGY